MRNGSNQLPESNSKRREIGDLAVWTLSSAKQGNGVDQLRDNNINTFWQSDGQQPHFINI
jgi:anaphase-promoting complex subunit 10